jgi:hypothetical protein
MNGDEIKSAVCSYALIPKPDCELSLFDCEQIFLDDGLRSFGDVESLDGLWVAIAMETKTFMYERNMDVCMPACKILFQFLRAERSLYELGLVGECHGIKPWKSPRRRTGRAWCQIWYGKEIVSWWNFQSAKFKKKAIGQGV